MVPFVYQVAGEVMKNDKEKNRAKERGSHDHMSDEDIALLTGDDLDEGERRRLAEKLFNDPWAADILALAMSDVPVSGKGLEKRTVDNCIRLVRERMDVSDICPYCAGDMHTDGNYCPHCGAMVFDNPLTCFKCSKPVTEGSRYCPNCGAVFADDEKKSFFESSLFLLILGLASLAVAALWRPLFLLFIVLGSISLGAWAWEVMRRNGASRKIAADLNGSREDAEEERDVGRRSG